MIKNKNLCINPHHAKCFVTMNMDLINEEDSIEDMTNELNTLVKKHWMNVSPNKP